MPGLHKSQTYVGEVYIAISLYWRCDKTEKKRFVRILTDVISFRDSAGLKQGNKDRPVSVLRKSAGFGP